MKSHGTPGTNTIEWFARRIKDKPTVPETHRFTPTVFHNYFTSSVAPALTIFLDINPETAVQRKAVDRDRYERDLALQIRVRESYRRQAAEQGWVVLDGERSKAAIAADVFSAAASRLAGQSSP